jgi:hypothetical protein
MTTRIAAAILTICLTAPAWSFTRDEVLLYVPFEGSALPLVATGEGAPDIQGEFSFAPGMVGEAILVGEADRQLHYPTAGNMNPNEGTWAIWVHSIDWELKEKVNRWWIDCPGPTRFILYHYLHSGTVFFYHMDRRQEQPSIIRAAADWQPAQWKHLAATWRDGLMRLYINGERVPEEMQVELGPLGEWLRVGGPGKGVDDTHLDELYVFSRALEEVEVRSLYQRGLAGEQTTISIPRISAPTLDGRLAQGEWADAAALTGFMNRVTGQLDAEQGVAWLGWDDANLYLAHRWLVPARVRREPDLYSFGAFAKNTTQRDDPALTDDDGVGLTIQQGDAITGLIVNALGTALDIKDRDLSWNANVQAGCTVSGDAWVCEMSIPLADLGLSAGDTFGLKVGRSHRLLRRDDCAWPATNPGLYAQATLSETRSAVRLTSIGEPWIGELDLTLTGVGDAPIEVTVTTDSGEVDETARLSPTARNLRVQRLLTNTDVTGLTVRASAGDDTLLAVTLPISYPPTLEVDKFVYPSDDLMRVVVNTRGAASASAVSIAVTGADSDEALLRGSAPGHAGDVRTVPIDISSLAPGDYTVRVAVGEGEAVIAREELPLIIAAKPEWLGNSIGIIDYVPEPWTAMEYEGDGMRCWGREIALDGTGLPAQMTSQGQALLTGPVRLVGTVDGAAQTLAPGGIVWTEQDDQAGRWTGTGKLGAVSVGLSAFAEFDGLLWFELTLTAPEGVTVDALRLEVPMAREESTLLYSGDYRTIDTGATPTERWARTFTPCLGLSNERVGLQWYAQSRRGWHLEDLKRAIEVIPVETANVLTVNFIDAPVELAGERIISFGLQPTPVKAPLPGRRMLRPAYNAKLQPDGPKPNIALWWTHWSLGCSYNWPIREERAEHVANRQRLDGQRVMAYTRLSECSVKGPWYAVFRDEWRVHPGPRLAPNEDVAWDATGNPACPGSRSWQDWTVWSLKKACGALGFDGLYYDVSRPPACANHQHGCGYLDDEGKWQPETQLLATRELQKRIWIMMHEDFDDKIITHHMSGHMYMITQAFSDVIIDGENYTSMFKDNYYSLLPLDKFRAEFMGHQWGPTACFLPEFTRALVPDKERYGRPDCIEVRHLAGMMFLHDSIPWPAYSHPQPYVTIWAAQDELGWGDDVEFLPYWDNAEYLAPMTDTLVASVFRKDGRALVVLLNNTDEPQDARLAFDLAKLGVDATKLRDFETGEEFALTAGAATVPITARNFRLLFMEP